MDPEVARRLLAEERARVEGLLAGLQADQNGDREAANDSGDWSDPAQSITAVGNDDVLARDLTQRLQAITRAEARLAAGTYGRSVRSGAVIPDARLEWDPAAELTVEEAAARR